MFDPISASVIAINVYDIVKFWGPLLAVTWAIFKGTSWIKDKFITIQETVHSMNGNLTSLKSEIETQTRTFVDTVHTQTSAYVGEIKELRSDFRTFYAPQALANFARNAPISKTRTKAATKKAVPKRRATDKK